MESYIIRLPDIPCITRRHFLWLSSVSAAGVLTGCAVNPVTGERQLMLLPGNTSKMPATARLLVIVWDMV